ncbi:MAG: LysR family transcriptional regulator [Paracoccaceae bacterium]
MTEPRIRLRLYFDNGLMFGPGKADLLAGIAEHGSISAAGRAMGMSYKRAWSLVEEMNAAFARPVVESARGGAAGGGAHLTDEGRAVLGHYRRLVDKARIEGRTEITALSARLRDMSGGK